MKKLNIVLCVLGCILSASSFAKDAKQAIDQIVAVVNDDVVTRSELNVALTAARMQMSQEHISEPPEKLLQKQVLDQLINKKLQLQIAKQAGINIKEEEVNQSIAQVAEQNKVSVADLYAHVAQEGMSKSSYQNEMRDQMAIQKLQQMEVVSHINITPDEIDSFMHSTAWKNNSSKEYHLEDMLIPVSDSPTTNELVTAKNRANAIVSKIRSGGSYQKVTAAEASTPAGIQGGDLGWRKLPEIPSAFADRIAHMKADEIAGPIQTSNGFHIIHLAAVRSAAGEDAQATRKQIEQQLLQRKFEEAMQSWVSKLRGQSFIETKVSV